MLVYTHTKKLANALPSDTDFTCINSSKRRLTRINLSIYCDHDYFWSAFILCFALALL